MSARRWLFVAAMAASCGVPALDTAGAIVCGPADPAGVGLCPNGFECRLERCCPTGSSPSTCPGVAAAPTGAPCTTAACTTTSTATTACCATTDARGGVVFRGGYATTLNCTSNGQCGAFGTCTTLTAVGRAACYRRCTYRVGAVTPCRDAPSELSAAPSGSYVCIADPEGRAPNDGICIPDCTAVSGLCGTDVCDATTHQCRTCTAGGCAAGTVCSRSSGQCTERCTLANAVAVCGALSLCTLSTGQCTYCTTASDCPALYHCNTSGRCVLRNG